MLKMLSAPALGLGASLTLCMLPAGCSCEACFTEPPPVVRMRREYVELERTLAYLAGGSEALLDLAQGVRAGESPPDELRALRKQANGLSMRVSQWRLGSHAIFKGEAFMALPPVDSPIAEPPRVDEVDIIASDPDRYYAALQQALPPMLEKCDQIESDLSAFLNDAAATQK